MWNYRPIVVIIVLYVAINIYFYSRPIVTVADNFTGFIFSGVGHRDLSIRFRNKPGP